MPDRPGRPNLLFIFTDQQRADTMAAYGNHWIQTPNLNRLAEGSLVFENGYVVTPICTPSRSAIITGLWPHTNGCFKNNIPLPQEIDTIADFLPNDYHKAYYGKWHLGDEVIKRRGWDEWHPIEDQYRVYHTDPDHDEVLSSYHHYLVDQGHRPDTEVRGKRVFSRQFAAELPEEHTKAHYLGERVSEYLRAHRDGPFALYVNFLEPHPPYTGPLNDLYDRSALPQSPTFMKDPPENASGMARLMAEAQAIGSDAPAPSAEQELQDGAVPNRDAAAREAAYREIQARYYGLVTLVDRAVGRILDTLDEEGLAENTIVVFTSEHGDQMGEHNIFHKLVMYEQTVRVPMFIRVPWLNRGRIPGRFSHIDLVPTLLDLMNANSPAALQGESRADVLTGESSLEGNDVFFDWNGRSIALKFPLTELERMREIPHRCILSADGWKLNLAVGDQCELYDLNSDPYEETNLFDDPGYGEKARELALRIRAWQKRTGDTAPLPDVFPGVGWISEMYA